MRSNISLAALLCVLFFLGCKKDQFNLPVKTNTNKVSASVTVPDSEKMVITPFGLRPQSQVQLLEEGYHLSYAGDHLVKVQNTTNKVVKDFGVQGTVNDKPIINRADRKTAFGIPGTTTGWVTDASWYNSTGIPISYFSTTWTVPNNPVQSSGQTIFVFNGIQGNSYVLQPVLQYGVSNAGGGNYWAVTNWYAGCDSCPMFYGSLVTVTPGTVLQGVMEMTGQSGGLFNYKSYFVGYPTSSAIQVSNRAELVTAYQTLETLNFSNSNQYPADVSVQMKNIEIRLGTSQASLNWLPETGFANYNEHTVVVSNSSPGGRVDLYFRNGPPPVPPVNINNAASVDWSNNASGSGTINAPAGTLVHLTVSAYGPGTTTQCQVSGATLSVSPGNYVYMQNNSLTQTFTMPASGYVSWNGYFSKSGSSGTGHISVY